MPRRTAVCRPRPAPHRVADQTAFPGDVYFVYYAGKEKFTRITEYKKFTLHKAPTTLVSLEIPSKQSKYYPLPMESEGKGDKIFQDDLDGVFSIGRAGSYLYNVDIDDTIRAGIPNGRTR